MTPHRYIQPDMCFTVPIEGGHLLLSRSYDVLHHFAPLNAFILKYWNQETRAMCDVIMHPESAAFLIDKCGIGVLERDGISTTEHERLLEFQQGDLSALDFQTPPDAL